mmetsp:Transcript_23779/g.39692  ORF Transcript_23779/g.39692 Transcript_23779/m.39692 type:complete len:215 (-) Transcript_23779:1237-1881(-)
MRSGKDMTLKSSAAAAMPTAPPAAPPAMAAECVASTVRLLVSRTRLSAKCRLWGAPAAPPPPPLAPAAPPPIPPLLLLLLPVVRRRCSRDCTSASEERKQVRVFSRGTTASGSAYEACRLRCSDRASTCSSVVFALGAPSNLPAPAPAPAIVLAAPPWLLLLLLLLLSGVSTSGRISSGGVPVGRHSSRAHRPEASPYSACPVRATTITSSSSS